MYNEAVERLKKYAENFEVGDPKKEGEHIGPVISETQYNKIQTLIQKGIDEGAKLVFGDGFEEHFIAFKILPTIVFFSAFISLLYHYNILLSFKVK